VPSNTLRDVEQSLGQCRQMTKPVLILTRPAPSSAAFAQSLPDAVLSRVDLLISPLLDIGPVGARISLEGIAGVIFSSANGVAFGPEPADIPAYCVGARTTEAALARGWRARLAGPDADSLVARLIRMTPPAPLMHLSGQHQRGDIALRLTQAGLPTQAVTVYDQALVPLSPQAKQALQSGGPCIVPLFSPRTAAQFGREAQGARRITVIALSHAVAAALGDLVPQRLMIAPEPSGDFMRSTLETALDRDS